MKFAVVLASDLKGVIAKNNQLPWINSSLKQEMKFFTDLTKFTPNPLFTNSVIMGRKTWESIGKIYLKGRINVVVSNTLKDGKNIHIQKSFEEAVDFIKNNYDDCVENIFAIGGEKIYKKDRKSTV